MYNKDSIVKLNQHGVYSIPKGWTQTKVKYIGNYINGFAFKPTDWSDYGKPILRIQNLTSNDGTINRFEGEIPQRYLITKGDILISWSASLGIFVWQGERSWLNQHIYKVAINKHKIDSNYFVWLAEWFINEMQRDMHGSTMQHLTTDAFGSFPVIIPNIEEQINLSNFLRVEVAKLDALITKKQTLISLLTEKRQALITQAVTKGLNPNVKMKDSGIDWLGEVPEHWKVKNLGYCGKFQNGLNKGGEYFGKGFPFYGYNDVYNNEVLPIDPSGLAESSLEERNTCSVQEGDVFFTRTSETIEDIAIASTAFQTVSNATFSGFLIRFRPYRNTINKIFSSYYFRCTLLRAYFVKEMNIVTRASMSQDILKKVPLLIPPLQEQMDIVVFLMKEINKFEAIIEKAKQSIHLLNERKVALITAAVTGQIEIS